MRKNIKRVRLKKSVFLKGVRERLKNEVGIYYKLLADAHSKDPDFPKVGFWAGIRLMMPVIEALSSTLMRETSKDKRPKPVRFMQKYLNIEYPYLVWEIYRHSLAHTDEMRGASYKRKRVYWGVSIGIDDHFFVDGQMNIDITKLYDDLLKHLDQSIKFASGNVYVESHVHYIRIPKELELEFKNIQQ